MAFSLLFFPFMVVFMIIGFAIIILVTAFWIWMIVDCAKRTFKNETEKIVWILVVILASWIGALIYYFTVKASNSKGISKSK